MIAILGLRYARALGRDGRPNEAVEFLRGVDARSLHPTIGH